MVSTFIACCFATASLTTSPVIPPKREKERKELYNEFALRGEGIDLDDKNEISEDNE